jgi:hypothetical protein
MGSIEKTLIQPEKKESIDAFAGGFGIDPDILRGRLEEMVAAGEDIAAFIADRIKEPAAGRSSP